MAARFKEAVLVVLAAALLVRLAVTLGRVILAPGARYDPFPHPAAADLAGLVLVPVAGRPCGTPR